MTREPSQERKMNVMMWIIGITFTAFLGIGAVQMISFGEVRAQTEQNSTDIKKIQVDYLPYFAYQYIVESNQKLINILSALPNTTKDDPRYLEAVKEWNQLQNDVIKQAGVNKTRGK